MKIIGQTERGFIVETDRWEINRVLGRGDYERDLVLKVGTTIDVAAIRSDVDAAKRVREDLAHAVKTLRAVSDVIEAQVNPVKEPEAAATPEPTP